MPHVDIKSFPHELNAEETEALAADITEVIIRHLHSKNSSVSVAWTQVQPEAWKEIWDSQIGPHMNELIKKPGYSM
ncbi:tautomerase PptA [Pseudocitrobacter faecalis]|uniref:tautomerase PptA n=1 Tax=Pseudocitrobacter faecalis TaxID=1398493 RepID=UPI001675C59D|nr:tautomerase PptA [Pseudocitrobacter faecalis]GHD91332.1 tautomerase PptA [Pseudocitrobacter faecalis]